MIKVSEFDCKKCGHVWISRVELPKCCPACKRRDYEKPKNIKKG